MSALTDTAPEFSLDARVEDYLEDKLQSAADLDTLDELLANIELQHNQLQAQLDNALKELEEARRTAGDRQGSLETQIEDFRQLQDSIDVRVKVAAASDAPSEAIARLQGPMKKLQTVELTQKYLILLQDVEKLRSEARSHLPGSPKAALEPYTRLKELALYFRSLPGSEALHLVDHIEKVAEMLWTEMKSTMSQELEDVLKSRGWPRVDPQSEMDEEWIACIEKLVDLQMPEVLHSGQTVSLLPFDVMSRMFVAEFRFHFLSDKPTSSSQSVGSHCFPWFLSTIEKWEDFFRDNLSHLLASKFHGTAVATKPVYVDPVSALITALLPVMREKLERVMTEALKNPKFLSSVMPQLITFDENIRSRFNYDEGSSDEGWPGLTSEVLDKHFESWFQVERSTALDQFEAIMESQDARKIDFDYASKGRMKPTFAAVRVTDLLRTITSKYERLRKLKHKLRFLTNIQLDILDGYHDRLRGSLEAYQSLTSTIGRTLHGVSKEQLAALAGTGALETLCKVIGSSDHVANTLAEWGDEEFFALLWEQLQSRNGRQSKSETSSNVDDTEVVHGSLSSSMAEGNEDGALFDETVSAYTNRRKAAEGLLVGALADSHSKAFRAYLNQVQWTTIGESAVLDDPAALSVTPELDEPLRILKRNFVFCIKALSTASLRRVWRQALEKLQDMLWNSVLMRQSFTTLGAAQFAHDCGSIFSLVDGYIHGGSAALDSLREGLVLLNLPAGSEDTGETQGESSTTLKEASDRAFKDNDEARKVLEKLHLGALTPLNARHILQRRVENNENLGW